MKAKVEIPGVAYAGDSLIKIEPEEYNGVIGTLGNDTDIVVKNLQGGMSIISPDMVLFEDEGIVVEESEINKDDTDENVVQDDEPEVDLEE